MVPRTLPLFCGRLLPPPPPPSPGAPIPPWRVSRIFAGKTRREPSASASAGYSQLGSSPGCAPSNAAPIGPSIVCAATANASVSASAVFATRHPAVAAVTADRARAAASASANQQALGLADLHERSASACRYQRVTRRSDTPPPEKLPNVSSPPSPPAVFGTFTLPVPVPPEEP